MTDLNKMWEALAAHQPLADARGYGLAWADMCDKKTEEAARNAAGAAGAARVAAWAAAWAAERAAAGGAMRADVEADFAIKCVTKAAGETK